MNARPRHAAPLLWRPNFVCTTCRQRLQTRPLSKVARLTKKHGWKWKYGEKLEAAEADWQKKAEEINDGKRESMLSILEARGYVHKVVGERDSLDELMTSKRIGAYVGIDPTAPSLHLGHLLPLMALLWMYINGFHAITLLGGATAQVGDPTGRTTSRETMHRTTRKANLVAMQLQLTKIWKNMELHATEKYGYKQDWAWKRGLVNNSIWMGKTPIMDFIKYAGRGLRVGPMLGRDTAKVKLEQGDGLSFAEFSYPLLQAWDWWQLFDTRNIQMQIGGSDQFGNIITGMECFNYVTKELIDPKIHPDKVGPLARPVAFTVPLLTTSGGEKFGKSAGNAVWLDPQMTSPFDLYQASIPYLSIYGRLNKRQFFLRSSDADVERYLKLFTLIPLSEIAQLLDTHTQDASKRVAQRRLAREVVELIHGGPEADQVETSCGMLFRDPRAASNPSQKGAHATDTRDTNVQVNPNAAQVNSRSGFRNRITLPRSLVNDQSFARILFHAGMVSSKSEGARLIHSGGAYVGGKKGKDETMSDDLSFVAVDGHWDPAKVQTYIMEDSLLLLRIGKWKVRMVNIVSDEEFVKEGLDAPGWKEIRASGDSSRPRPKVRYH